MGISRHPYDKSGLGYEENKKYDAKSHSKYSIIHNHRYPINRYHDRKQKLQASSTNTEGPKRNWVPRKLNTSLTDKSSKWRTISETNPRATDIHISWYEEYLNRTTARKVKFSILSFKRSDLYNA